MARSTLSNDNEAEVQLRELERDAASKATIYEAFLTRAGVVTERQQLDTTNIRVMSPATVPETGPGHHAPPRRPLPVLPAVSFGGLLSIAFGLFMDRGRRQAEPFQ
jgi:succinoglycan biosynthesis transport protein ExoP